MNEESKSSGMINAPTFAVNKFADYTTDEFEAMLGVHEEDES